MMETGQTIVPSDEGDPGLDPRAFRRALGNFATGVTIVTTVQDGRAVGVTANSFTSVSLDPPLILWSIDRKATSFAAFMAAAHFAVNVLAEDQLAISRGFARSGSDRFAGVDWTPGAGGVPLLNGVAAPARAKAHSGRPCNC
jgi:flavin reductase (DIM6/NTAB) family NADH-FMN oxidoreductase RutF